ncbi:hypothetical protein RFI_26393 [Reticulomyxa filosa]|uniref:Uncharacterized protein n=1 Tax=Reticulomyxa filosa TaxID=46433 RepID=X6MAW0_RETFI|nr:hypothetical protein RFI_26393 [Reticulomyxa filosa]|eukprot:ETO10984.1 hypothetical protein RFI_26393 [Reticulomyxa filosa]
MDSSLVYENILTTLQVLVVVLVVPSAKFVTRDSPKENVQIHSNNDDNMCTTTTSSNTFNVFGEIKKLTYTHSQKHLNDRSNAIQWKCTYNNKYFQVYIEHIINIIHINIQINMQIDFFKKKQKHIDLAVSKYITILLVQNKVASVEENDLGNDAGLFKNVESRFALIRIRYVGDVELLQLYMSLVEKFSVRTNVSIR